jgi:hypothetical protein
VGGGCGFRLDRVDAPWGWSSVGRRSLIRPYAGKGVISDTLASLVVAEMTAASMGLEAVGGKQGF